MKTAIAVVAAAIAGAVAVWFGMDNAANRQTIARLESDLARAHSMPAAAQTSPTATPNATPPQQQAPATPGHSHFESTANPEADLLRARLAESRRAIDDLNNRVRQLQDEAAQAADERSRAIAGATAQLQTKLDETTRTVQALSAERAELGKRVAALEAANAQLRNARASSDGGNVQLTRLISDLEDVGRRQQTYLANILRRYRDVTEQFRVLPAALDRNGANSGPEISRIQTALAMADEDLRQLNDLNTRLVRVQKQLVAAAAQGK